MKLPEHAPPWMPVAARELGVNEKENNREIMGYARDAKVKSYDNVTVPWCSVFACAILERTGIKSVRSAWARDNLNWGQKLREPKYGAITVFKRGRTGEFGHVGFFLRTFGDYIEVLNGNVSDSVCVSRLHKSTLLGYRWPAEVVEKKPVVEVPTQPATPKVPDGPLQPPNDSKQSVPAGTPAAFIPEPSKQQLFAPQAQHETKAEVLQRLKSAGSRTIRSVSRVIYYIKTALSGLGIFGIADVTTKAADVKEALPLIDVMRPFVWVVFAALLGAILYEMFKVQDARVDDDVNGQQERR